MKVRCVECGYVKKSKYNYDVCPICRGTMTKTGKEMPSLLGAIANDDKKLIAKIEKSMKSGEIVRIY
jgi:hypothetical protein